MKKILVVFLFLAACSPTPTLMPTASSTNQPTDAKIATATATLASATPTVDESILLKEYNPNEWALIYDKGMVYRIAIGPEQEAWVMLSRGRIASFYEGIWTTYKVGDFGLSQHPLFSNWWLNYR
jgi:hypothetical protein